MGLLFVRTSGVQLISIANEVPISQAKISHTCVSISAGECDFVAGRVHLGCGVPLYGWNPRVGGPA